MLHVAVPCMCHIILNETGKNGFCLYSLSYLLTTINTLSYRLLIEVLYKYDTASFSHGQATCNIYPLPIFSKVKPSIGYAQMTERRNDHVEIDGQCWFETAVCPCFSSNNGRLLACVFTGGDPLLE